MRRKDVLVLAVLLIATPQAFAAEAIDDWKVFPVPGRDEILESCENSSDFVWIVKSKRGRIEAERQSLEELYRWQLESARETPQFSVGKYKTFPRLTHEVPNGTLVGYNQGEWGGAVWWFSKNRKIRRAISKHQVEAFFERDGDIYALEGLSHMAPGHGSLIKFWFGLGKEWRVDTIAILPGQPGPYTWIGPRQLLVVAEGKLVRLDLDGDRKTLHAGGRGFGRASSILVDSDGRVHVGAGGVVIRLTPQNDAYREEWLVRQTDLDSCKCRIVEYPAQGAVEARKQVLCH